MKSLGKVLIGLAILLVFAACSSGAQPTQNIDLNKETEVPKAALLEGRETEVPKSDHLEEADSSRILTDIIGREINLPREVNRVVVTFNLEEYLSVAGAEGVKKLVGYGHAYWEGRRNDAWTTFTNAFPQLKDITDVGYNDSISVENIISLDPDVVIMSSAVNYNFIEPHLEALLDAGIPVAFINYHEQTLEAHRNSTLLLGEIMGQQERSIEIADFYEAQMKIVTDRIATLSEKDERPLVYMEFSRGVNSFGNSWSNKMWGALIKTCGGINIAADLSDANSVDVAPEYVLSSNPDVIIFAASPQKDIDDNIVLGYGTDAELAVSRLAAYKNREGWSTLKAVQTDSMGALYHDLSRHIFDFAGAQFLAKMIHPELFADINPEANLQLFFEKFMPVELEGSWTVSLR